MYLPSGSAVQGSGHPPGKLAVYPRFQRVCALPLLLLAALSGDVETAVGERATGFCEQLVPPLPCRWPRVRVCKHGWGGARARPKEAASPFFPAAFSNLFGPLQVGRENRRENPLQNSCDPCGRLDCCRLDR